MSETVETVRIAAAHVPGGFIVINKSDLKPEDVLYEEGRVSAEKTGKPKKG